MSSAAIWHEVECGGYGADLGLWERLADAAGGSILELGCGTGRVALHLARRGHEVCAVDADPSLLDALETRAMAEGLTVDAVCSDIRALGLDRRFDLIIAPMQVLQMLGGEAERGAGLRSAATHLASGGRLAAAIVELPSASLDGAAAAFPDIRERDGWMYSSLPVAVATEEGGLEIRRLRQAVSPDGGLSEEESVERLDALDLAGLEAEAGAAGLRVAERVEVPAEDGYLGSVVLVLEHA